MNALKRMLAMLLAMLLLAGYALAEDDDEEIDFTSVSGQKLTAEELEEEEDAAQEFVLDDELTERIEDIEQELDTSVNPDDLELNANLPDHVINILLIGVDTRETDLDTGLQHGDVMIVLSVDTETNEIKLTSMLRDLYVTIPGYKNKTRLNNAYAYGTKKGGVGGGILAMRTVNHNFELNCQHYVTINFYGLASIIDAIGGIDVDLTAREAGAINTYLRKHPPKYDNTDGTERVALERVAGVHHLDGVQAVMYARLREIDNDFQRTERQRHLLELLLEKVTKDITMDKLFTLVDACLPYVKTNLTAMTMLSLATELLQSGIADKSRSGEELLQQFRIPMAKSYSYKTIDGMSVIYLSPNNNFPKNVKALHEFIYGEYIPTK